MSNPNPTNEDAQEAVRTLLRYIGEDPAREGLIDTPKRVAKALREMTSGLAQDEVAVLGTTFEAEGYDEIVLVRDIEFTSLCEHHLLTFKGHAHVGYLPRARVVGLSKIPRMVDVLSRRPQIQERMTKQVADALENALDPRGVFVVIEGEHSCMSCRGVRKHGAAMVTSCVRGVFRDNVHARAEAMSLINRKG